MGITPEGWIDKAKMKRIIYCAALARPQRWRRRSGRHRQIARLGEMLVEAGE